jgi:hypothetical protein
MGTPPSLSVLRKVFKVGTLSPDLDAVMPQSLDFKERLLAKYSKDDT